MKVAVAPAPDWCGRGRRRQHLILRASARNTGTLTSNDSTSKNRIQEARPLFYFYVPDGASASDFLLIKLEKKGNRREFQVRR